MGEGFQFIDIVLFAMIAAFLILRLRSVLGRHRDSGRTETRFGGKQGVTPQEDQAFLAPEKTDDFETPNKDETKVDEAVSEQSLLDRGLNEIKKAAPDFDKGTFLSGVREAFQIIIKAFADGNRDQLQSLLSEEVYSNFSNAIASRESAKEKLENTLIRVVDIIVLEAFMEDTISNITVKIISEQNSVTINSTDEVVDGSTDYISEITDIWTFARNTKARDPNWELVATRSLD